MAWHIVPELFTLFVETNYDGYTVNFCNLKDTQHFKTLN